MQKLFWICSTLGAAALTTAVLSMTDTSDLARERAGKQPTASLAESDEPVVVEFFTSQGCSSCPPSDRLAARLAREPGVLVIQRPVTYWDRLGWRDTLASAENTRLQRSYASSGLVGRNGVYTPQAVVGGRSGLVGSQEAELRRRIRDASRIGGTAILVEAQTLGRTGLTIENGPAAAAQVFLVGLDRDETVEISRGENGGRSLSYTNIWKGERLLGNLRGGAGRFVIEESDKVVAGANRYAVIVRQGPDGPILAGKILT